MLIRNCRAALDQYSLELKRVSSILVKTMARCLGVEALTDMFIDGLQSMRMNYYPACRQTNKVLGLSPHSDAVGLTLLLQVNQVQGLQIKKNGAWMPIKPLPGAFIVNIGDILEVNLTSCSLICKSMTWQNELSCIEFLFLHR